MTRRLEGRVLSPTRKYPLCILDHNQYYTTRQLVTGIDNLLGRFLKDRPKVLASSIAQICSLSIKFSTVPDEFKMAKLKPLYKKDKKTDPKNYKPISLFPVTSKNLEKVIHHQTMEFGTKNSILYKFQSGFRKVHSTDSCLLHLQQRDFIQDCWLGLSWLIYSRLSTLYRS